VLSVAVIEAIRRIIPIKILISHLKRFNLLQVQPASVSVASTGSCQCAGFLCVEE
jgi:hypothetical protein